MPDMRDFIFLSCTARSEHGKWGEDAKWVNSLAALNLDMLHDVRR